MKKLWIGLMLVSLFGCAKKSDHPAQQALARFNAGVSAGRGTVLLEQLTPRAVSEIGSRLGLGQKASVKEIAERLAVVPGVGFEKVTSFRPQLMRDRSSPVEHWYRIELGGQRMQVPVKKMGDSWKVALNEAVMDG